MAAAYMLITHDDERTASLGEHLTLKEGRAGMSQETSSAGMDCLSDDRTRPEAGTTPRRAWCDGRAESFGGA